DASADIDKGIEMALNGKTRRCSVCNATETVLLDKALDKETQLRVVKAFQDAGVTVHGHLDELEALDAENVHEAEQWNEEHLTFDIRITAVDGVNGAIEHIKNYTTGHTEG